MKVKGLFFSVFLVVGLLFSLTVSSYAADSYKSGFFSNSSPSYSYYPVNSSGSTTLFNSFRMNDGDLTTFCRIVQNVDYFKLSFSGGGTFSVDRLFLKADSLSFSKIVLHGPSGDYTILKSSVINGGYTTFPSRICTGATIYNLTPCNIYEFDLYNNLAPSVVKTVPSDLSSMVGVSSHIEIHFNTLIDSSSLDDVSFDGVSFSASVSNGNKLMLRPLNKLEYGKEYTVSVNGVSGLFGIKMSVPYTFSFTTQSDNTKVEVIAVEPPDMSEDVSISTDIKVTFNKINIDSASINGIILKNQKTGDLIPVSRSVSGSVVTLTLDAPLEYLKSYTIEIKGVKDSLGNSLYNPVTASFTTSVDKSPLSVVSIRPPDSSLVSLTDRVEIVFNKAVKDGTLQYTLENKDGHSVVASVMYQGEKVVVVPALLPGAEYTFTLNSATDIYGNVLGGSYSINFRTMASTGNDDFDKILNNIIGIFGVLREHGLIIVSAAVLLGIFFIVAKWLWGKLRQWLQRAK